MSCKINSRDNAPCHASFSESDEDWRDTEWNREKLLVNERHDATSNGNLNTLTTFPLLSSFFFTDCSRPRGPIVSGPIEPSSAKARYFTRMAIDTRLSFKGQPLRQLFEKLFVSSSGRGKSIRFFAVFASDSRFPIYSSTC